MKMGSFEYNFPVDEYEIQARILPAFLVWLPFAFGAIGAFVTYFELMKWVFSVAVSVGLIMVFKEAGRAGRKKEPALWQIWGGKPTTLMLSHLTTTLDPYTLRRYHDGLSRVTGQTMPSRDEESANKKDADHRFEFAVKWLRENTRDKEKFDLVFKENISYGFRRNLWGMKPLAILLTFLALIVTLLPIAEGLSQSEQPEPYLVIIAVSCVIILLTWLFLITPEWVREPGDAYAERLLETISDLHKEGNL